MTTSPDGVLWQPSLSAVEDLGRMLQQVQWGAPLEGAQRQCLSECASWVHAGVTNNPFQDPTLEDLALSSVTAAVLEWVEHPQDLWLVVRVKGALVAYWDLVGEK